MTNFEESQRMRLRQSQESGAKTDRKHEGRKGDFKGQCRICTSAVTGLPEREHRRKRGRDIIKYIIQKMFRN